MEWLPIGMVGIIAYFLKNLHHNITQNDKDVAGLKSEVALIKSESNNKIDNLTETTNIQIQNLTKAVEDLTYVSNKILLRMPSE